MRWNRYFPLSWLSPVASALQVASLVKFHPMLKPIFTDSGTPREILLVSKRQVDLHDLKVLRDLPEKRREAKAKEIRTGAQLLQKKRFPTKRRYQDHMWAAVFLFAMLAFVGYTIMFLREVDTSRNSDSDFTGKQTVDKWAQRHGKHLQSEDGHAGKLNLVLFAAESNLVGIGSAVGAMILAFLFLSAIRVYPRPALYSALFLLLILSMVLSLVATLFALRMPSMEFYMLLLAAGMVVLCAVAYGACLWCWYPSVEFTLEIVEMVADISNEAPRLLLISLLGPLLFIVLLASIVLARTILLSMHEKDFANQNKNEIASVDLACILLLLWGSNVIDKMCHMAFCGAFSRWYFSVDGLLLLDSLHVAATTSFGTVCFGALVVVLIKTLHRVVRPVEKVAGDRNAISSVIGCIIDLIIVCTGDLVEYFDDWTYTQCAVRGTSFCESARSTYSLIACNGLPTVIDDLLLDFVLQPGSILCGLTGLSLVIANSLGNRQVDHLPQDFDSSLHQIDLANSLTGLVGGFIGGAVMLRLFCSGAQAILLCWAENPIPLHKEHDFEGVHTELTAKIRDAEMS